MSTNNISTKLAVVLAIVVAVASVALIIAVSPRQSSVEKAPASPSSGLVLDIERKLVKKANALEYEMKRAEERQKVLSEAQKRKKEESERKKELELDPEHTDWVYEPDGVKEVYLTFDDGPSSMTEQVLDVLDRYDVHATFFVTAQYPDYFHFIGEAYRKGNAIALHTYSHDYGTVYASDAAYFDDLDKIGRIVEEQIGFVPFMVRFPGGSSNTVSANYSSGIMSRLVDEVNARGYQYYDWNASTGDGGTVDEQTAIEQATKGIGQEDVVILAHDTPAKQSTVDALPEIIEAYQEAGYEFKTIDRSAYAPHHGVNN